MIRDQLRILVIAGPNGADETTFVREHLPNEAGLPTFVNADLVAAGLSPFRPEAVAVQAGRMMIGELRRLFAARASFAFETTLAGRGYVRSIREWQAAGYRVKPMFPQLDRVEVAIERVALRVAQGEHAIPEDVIRRRFVTGRSNFDRLYAPLADEWGLYDASQRVPVLIDRKS